MAPISSYMKKLSSIASKVKSLIKPVPVEVGIRQAPDLIRGLPYREQRGKNGGALSKEKAPSYDRALTRLCLFNFAINSIW